MSYFKQCGMKAATFHDISLTAETQKLITTLQSDISMDALDNRSLLDSDTRFPLIVVSQIHQIVLFNFKYGYQNESDDYDSVKKAKILRHSILWYLGFHNVQITLIEIGYSKDGNSFEI